ncbi:MFS transporter [Antribacter sp. KLBMP9083]|uniref:MFS transporter n=1 Tax=Antribacter soli TaxID=2910976 RepID=A0AA41QCI2_9MICO|nr:MFS transporter [Antribacter soli]MCF4120622.1 MFS transporter [Antribacter soli]
MSDPDAPIAPAGFRDAAPPDTPEPASRTKTDTPSDTPAPAPAGAGRNVVVLVVSNLLAGVGVASGAAVGALLAEDLGGTSVAGLAQATGVLAAAVASIPLAGLAARRGRRRALALGYALATVGALLIVTAALAGQFLLLLVGLALYGIANATNLQSRYAAGENAGETTRGRTMAVVLWATTVGSVAGPNLAGPGAALARAVGLPVLAGPYLFSLAAYVLAGTVIALLYRSAHPVVAPATPPGATALGHRRKADGALASLAWALRMPRTRFAVVTTAVAHSVMIMVMVMTPLHMQHGGMSLELVGLVISLHVLGMFAFSPVFGWLTDRLGPTAVGAAGLTLQASAVAVGLVAARAAAAHGGHGTESVTAIALVLLGLGWSACVISASAVLAAVPDDRRRLPLQGATDALMNYAGAAAAAVAGPLLAWGGFQAVNVAGAVLLVPAVVTVLLVRFGRAA